MLNQIQFINFKRLIRDVFKKKYETIVKRLIRKQVKCLAKGEKGKKGSKS